MKFCIGRLTEFSIQRLVNNRKRWFQETYEIFHENFKQNHFLMREWKLFVTGEQTVIFIDFAHGNARVEP